MRGPSDPTVVKAVITKDCVEGRSGPELTHDPKKIKMCIRDSLLDEYRAGKLGRFTLEMQEEPEQPAASE